MLKHRTPRAIPRLPATSVLELSQIKFVCIDGGCGGGQAEHNITAVVVPCVYEQDAELGDGLGDDVYAGLKEVEDREEGEIVFTTSVSVDCHRGEGKWEGTYDSCYRSS